MVSSSVCAKQGFLILAPQSLDLKRWERFNRFRSHSRTALTIYGLRDTQTQSQSTVQILIRTGNFPPLAQHTSRACCFRWAPFLPNKSLQRDTLNTIPLPATTKWKV